jgi:hypothetical protein
MTMARKKRYPWTRELYRYWILDREGEYVGDGKKKELSEEEQQRLERSKAHHPSQGRTMEP